METGRKRDGAALIALDWGTSSLRGFLMDSAGTVLEQRANAHGIQNLPQPGLPGFEQAFAGLCGDWLAGNPGVPVVAGGMVGSAQGWAEAPYVACPADTGTLAGQAIAVDSAAGVRILIAPGVTYAPPDAPPDILRGEEIQIAGVLADRPDWAHQACMVLPGTHSKWVQIEDGRMTRFATYMTGELFAVLTKHSILGRLMPADADIEARADADARDAAFADGVRAAQASGPGDLSHQIFAARTLGITRRMAPELLKDFLSGLLIGHEMVSGLTRMGAALGSGRPLLLIGDGMLCRRYVQGLALLGIEPTARLENTAPKGLFQFAIAAGLIAPPAGKDTHV
ncbi:2-keto-3-deoxy-galactonokinase [Azospirillum melinis]|uniref:2-keto-3-deoxy-galactonokinase n=1 Tax=Azospirillum melinis TaxID=328839 RepID=A0ABX2K911_9PROT|nr:2-dehydro-3-deoxygalactonokinase [Azospirillum melinis]MBP2309215.1 2-dehydro-3-deoxygalactonokinase [Azospirillum melinis]NUA99010.1 2-keto-3-deoxy-galactonokinase [Azospirillum melinis]